MTASSLVIDASVVVEYLVRLEHFRAATEFFVRAVDDDLDLWAPDLVFTETLSALRKLVRRKAITPRDGQRAAAWLANLPLLTTGTGTAVAEIWELRNVMTPYDAAYAVLAKRLQVPLVTADAKLARAVLRKGGDAILLGEAEFKRR